MDDLSHKKADWRDVAGLTRQVLLTSAVTYGGNSQLVVPVDAGWPTPQQWDLVHCSSVPVVSGELSVQALDWEPPSPSEDTESRILARDQVRAAYRDVEPEGPDLLQADPFWKAAHHYPVYRGQTQRQAARAAMLNDGGALVVALPTGRGKTAVAWSKALLSVHGVTIVVVPTIVLALDMERRTAELAADRDLPLSPLRRYAYVGSLDQGLKDDLRQQVRTGQQRLLYTSPEALVSGLASSVLECAHAGYLQQIVIDEAHLVDHWGANFRPEFQTMPGLIREAYERAPEGKKPSVLLLSATLSQQPLDLLTKLFAVGGEPVQLVWGSELRTEPAFFLDAHRDEAARSDAILKAVSCLPRPLILYTTKVEDAETWAALLREQGLSRVGCVTGNSSDDERRSVIERWRGLTTSGHDTKTSLDVIVGTSAFGLGLDMPNVRSVLHACLPESVDRYYQEVGRAGRDGRPSVAYLCTSPSDKRVAESLSRVVLIGDERGWERWRRLLTEGTKLTSSRYRVQKSTLPVYLDEGYGRSAQWNVRTLTLMAQAGVIELRVPRWIPDPLRSADEQESDREAFFGEVEDFIEFDLVNGELQGEPGWKEALGDVRHAVQAAQRQGLQSLLALAQGQECVGRVIARHFQVSYGGGRLSTQPVCRGCPACRRAPKLSPGVHPQEPNPLLPAPRSHDDPLASWRGDSPALFASYGEGEDPDPLLIRLAQRNVSVFWGLESSAADRLQRAVPHKPIVLDDPDPNESLTSTYAGVITFVLTGPRLAPEINDRIKLGLLSYIAGPETTPDPDRPDWLLRDTDTAKPITVKALLESM